MAKKEEKKKGSLLGRAFTGLVVIAVLAIGGSMALAHFTGDPSLSLLALIRRHFGF